MRDREAELIDVEDREAELIDVAESIADTYTRSYPTETDEGAILRGLLLSTVAIARLLYMNEPEKADDTAIRSVKLSEIPKNIGQQIEIDSITSGVTAFCNACTTTIDVPKKDMHSVFIYIRNHVARNH